MDEPYRRDPTPLYVLAFFSSISIIFFLVDSSYQVYLITKEVLFINRLNYGKYDKCDIIIYTHDEISLSPLIWTTLTNQVENKPIFFTFVVILKLDPLRSSWASLG